MGLDGPIPEGLSGCTSLRPGTEFREFPARYLTPHIRRLHRLWLFHDNGHRLRDDGVLHWPAKLVQAFDLIDRETRARRAYGNRR